MSPDGAGVAVGTGVGVVPGGTGAGGRAIVCDAHLPSERQRSNWIAEIAFGLVSIRRSMLRQTPSPSRTMKDVSSCPEVPSTVIVSFTAQQSFGSASLTRP